MRPTRGSRACEALTTLALSLALSLAVPAIVRADRAEAARLYREAMREYDADRPNFAEALRLFEASFGEHPTASAIYGMVLCHRARGHHAEAAMALERFLEMAEPRDFALVDLTPERANAMLAELRELIGTLELEVEPEGAEIEVDGEVRGEAPLAHGVLLGPGPHRIRVSADGYLTWAREVEIVSGEVSEIDVSLDALADQATLVLQASPEVVGAWLDGLPIGETPLSADLDPGEHTLRLWRSGYYEHIETITVGPSQRLARNIGMTEDVVWNHWLFWTIVGAAAVGAGVGLYFLLRPVPESLDGTWATVYALSLSLP